MRDMEASKDVPLEKNNGYSMCQTRWPNAAIPIKNNSKDVGALRNSFTFLSVAYWSPTELKTKSHLFFEDTQYLPKIMKSMSHFHL